MKTTPLRQYRIDRGWKLKQAAKYFGISVSHLSDLETGKSKPSVTAAAKLSKKTEIPAVVLLGLESAA